MKLFESGKIGSMELKNRIVMAPMGTRGLSELDGRFSQRGIDYYMARARGGTGLIITGTLPLNVVESHLVDGYWSFRPRVDNPVYVARLNELADAVHHYEVKIAGQLMAGMGRVGHITVSTHPVAPSPVPCFWNPNINARELAEEEIATIIKAFGNAVSILKMAEFDAVEINGHTGYLLDQFNTSLWNKRTDRYGGDLASRLRISLEIIEEIKKVVGDEFPIIYRFSARHNLEGGRNIEESQEIAQRLEAAGVAALHVDAGCYETWYWAHPPIYQPAGCLVDCAVAMKEVVKIPVIAVGKLGNAQIAERVLEEGKADFIALGRPLLADPDWPKKVKEKRFEDIRPCIGDHDGCLSRIVVQARYLSCTVNPQTGMEKEYAPVPAEKPRTVLVIGGGPGGLEAARVAAFRGHQVTLWEKNNRLGGNLLSASVPDWKQDLRDLISYFTTQIKKLGVTVELGKCATAESIVEVHPEVVILATGASPLIPKISGVGRKNVVTGIDLLLGTEEVGDRVIIAGGGVIGCEVGIYLAQKGKKVTIIEMMAQLIPEEINLANKMMLVKMVNDSGITVITGARLEEITEESVVANVNGTEEEIPGDSVVLALGLKPRSELKESLTDAPFEVFAIGDSVKPGRIINAIWEGFHTARLI
jgi:2-enoate reductase